jgi:imidazolonepropionase
MLVSKEMRAIFLPMRTVIHHIKELLQVLPSSTTILRGESFSTLPSIKNAWLLIEGERIIDFGQMENCPAQADYFIDATDRLVLPTWCDSHTHIVFAGSRETEFLDKIKGVPYEEIARKGGGILNSANLLQNTPEEVLLEAAWQRLEEVKSFGTGAIEIKSGYGLSTAAELKMLRVIRRLKEKSPMPIKATFLGAHTIPSAYKENRQAYIRLLIDEMLPLIAAEQLADYIDVFCEKVAFSTDETEKIIIAGAKYGLKAKIHTNQFNSMGGIECSIKHNAVSVDHLEVMTDEEVAVLKNSDTIATLLPSAPFFLNDYFPPAKKMIDANIAIALASDYNPGSSPSGNMQLVMSLACIKMKMTPEEVINAATLNGAAAMELQGDYGSITRGKIANLIITKAIPSATFIPYAFGSNNVERVILKGNV